MFRDCHFRPRNHCRKILINREIKIDSLSIQANCNCSNIICSVILALSVYTLTTLRDGHYFIDEGGGGGWGRREITKKNPAQEKPGKNIGQRGPLARKRNMWYGSKNIFCTTWGCKNIVTQGNCQPLSPHLPIHIEWPLKTWWHLHRSVENLTEIEEFVTRMELRLNVFFLSIWTLFLN